jgi:EpsI family protein
MPAGSKYARILTAAFLLQGALFYAASRDESVPAVKPLEDFPRQISDWRTLQEGHVDNETQSVLRADDTLTRNYGNPAFRSSPNLFIAFFKTQRSGKAPHSPKNCLPGAGWEASREDFLQISVPDFDQPIVVNRYLVARGEERSLVLYWYQTQKRVIASEYKAKFWTVADAIRYNRTDMAVVRVVVPVIGRDEATAEKAAVAFVQAFFSPLRRYLPA